MSESRKTDVNEQIERAEDMIRFCADNNIPIKTFTIDVDVLADIFDPECEYTPDEKLAIFDELARRAYCVREGMVYSPNPVKGRVKVTLKSITRCIDNGLRSYAKRLITNRANGSKGGRPVTHGLENETHGLAEETHGLENKTHGPENETHGGVNININIKDKDKDIRQQAGNIKDKDQDTRQAGNTESSPTDSKPDFLACLPAGLGKDFEFIRDNKTLLKLATSCMEQNGEANGLEMIKAAFSIAHEPGVQNPAGLIKTLLAEWKNVDDARDRLKRAAGAMKQPKMITRPAEEKPEEDFYSELMGRPRGNAAQE